MIWHQGFRVTGVLNSTIFDTGLESTEKEAKTLLSILIQVSDYKGNDIEGWIEKGKVFDIPDKLIDTDIASGTDQYRSGVRINEIPVNADLAIGERFKIAIRCGADATNLVGAYVYEIKGS